MDLLRQLLSPDCWAVSNPGALGSLAAALYAVLGLGFAATAASASPRGQCSRRGLPATRGLFLLRRGCASPGLFALMAWFVGLGGLSAQAWPLACLPRFALDSSPAGGRVIWYQVTP